MYLLKLEQEKNITDQNVVSISSRQPEVSMLAVLTQNSDFYTMCTTGVTIVMGHLQPLEAVYTGHVKTNFPNKFVLNAKTQMGLHFTIGNSLLCIHCRQFYTTWTGC